MEIFPQKAGACPEECSSTENPAVQVTLQYLVPSYAWMRITVPLAQLDPLVITQCLDAAIIAGLGVGSPTLGRGYKHKSCCFCTPKQSSSMHQRCPGPRRLLPGGVTFDLHFLDTNVFSPATQILANCSWWQSGIPWNFVTRTGRPIAHLSLCKVVCHDLVTVKIRYESITTKAFWYYNPTEVTDKLKKKQTKPIKTLCMKNLVDINWLLFSM